MRLCCAMARTRVIPDSDILALVFAQSVASGAQGVSFATVAAASGLSAPALVQRYGSREAMLRAAVLAAWERLDAATGAAEDAALVSAKGALGLLKALGEAPELGEALILSRRDPALAARAAAWRARVEEALAFRLGGGTRGREAAAMLFAAWQGRKLWEGAGDKGFSLSALLRRIA